MIVYQIVYLSGLVLAFARIARLSCFCGLYRLYEQEGGLWHGKSEQPISDVIELFRIAIIESISF